MLPQLLQRGILLGGLGGCGDEVPRLLTGAPAPTALLDVAALLPLCASGDARVSTTGAPGSSLRKGHESDKRSTVQWDAMAEAKAGQAGCSSGVEYERVPYQRRFANEAQDCSPLKSRTVNGVLWQTDQTGFVWVASGF